MRLAVLEGALQPLLVQALDESWPLWHDGLARPAYGAYNAAQLKTPWGAAHLARVGLLDGDRLLASAKRYALTVWLDGRRIPALGIGAVFTPPASSTATAPCSLSTKMSAATTPSTS